MIEETNKLSPLSAKVEFPKVDTLYIRVYNNSSSNNNNNY